MKWRGRERSSNVTDRRRSGAGGRSGRSMRIPIGRGGGVGGVLGLLVIGGLYWFLTGDIPIDLLTGGGSSAAPSYEQSRPLPEAGEDDLADFVGVVVRDTEVLWDEQFTAAGGAYEEPDIILFTGQTRSGCGVADARTGPFYCPADESVYIDLSFYDQLRREFGAPGDFAQAYVLAHEVGHHVQNLTGVLGRFNSLRGSMSQAEANQYSVRVELQADCYAGVWAHYAGTENLLEAGDAEEAINAASQIGDDTLQERIQGYVVPKTFNHGTSAQRREWFTRGFESGSPADCDTFSNAI